MAKSRLRSNRAKYKPSEAKYIGWSKGKTNAIVIILAVLAAVVLFVFIALLFMS